MTLFFLRKTGVSLGINILSFVLIISFGMYATSLHIHIKELEQHLLFLKRQIVLSQEEATLINAHEKEFLAFEACKFEQPISPEMLQRSIPHTIEFGQISNLDTDPRNKGLVSQDLYLLISSLQDRDIFALLDHLLNEGPGLFQIHGVMINRISALTEEMLEKIADGKPQVLFDGKVTATWIHR